MPLRLMCFTAHPDDECGAFGGALMLAHQRGVETSVVCLTEGRAASHRGDARSGEELANLRRQEFAAALRVLGVAHGEVLAYPDGQLAQQDFSGVTADLVERIRPEVLIPIHCTKPETYLDMVSGICDIRIPKRGVPIEF